MLIAVFIFFFFKQKLLLNAFFSTTLIVLYHSNAQQFDNNKSLDSIPHPQNLNLFGELLTIALAKD